VGNAPRLGLVGDVEIVEALAGLPVGLGVGDEADHGAAVLGDAEVANGALVGALEVIRRRHLEAVLLHQNLPWQQPSRNAAHTSNCSIPPADRNPMLRSTAALCNWDKINRCGCAGKKSIENGGVERKDWVFDGRRKGVEASSTLLG